MALYYHNYSTWTSAPGVFLEDLYIVPEYRSKGVGTTLLNHLAKEVKKIGGARLDWQMHLGNEKAENFYRKKLRASSLNDWINFRLEGDSLDSLAEGKTAM